MGTRKSYIDNTVKAHLTNSVSRINKDKICPTYISPKKRTALLFHLDSKARTKCRKLWSDRARATYPPKLRVTQLKDVTSRVRILELLDYQQPRRLTLYY